jgi:ligand-binding sensor domain-containing protein
LDLWLLNLPIVLAADLKFNPTTPIVEINKTITLSVIGAVGSVEWTVMKGKIQGDGNQVTYLAPDQAGLDAVTVLDSEGNTGLVKVIITPFATVSAENAQWTVFSNLDEINNLVQVEGSTTFLAETPGGLAQYEVATGELKRIFTQKEGLPDNRIVEFLEDEGRGIWIGTGNGLAYYSNLTDNLTPYDTPLREIFDFCSDDKGGIWVSFAVNDADIDEISEGDKPGFTKDTPTAIAHFDINKKWTTYPIDSVAIQIVSDNHGGVWTITFDENKEEPFMLRHLLSNGEWVIYTTKALGLSGGFEAYPPEPDGQGGVWVGMKGHVVHFSFAGDWKIYSAKEVALSENTVILPISINENGTVNVVVGYNHFELSNEGVWTPVTIDIPQQIQQQPALIADDGNKGFWGLARDRHLWHRNADKKWIAYPETSNYPYTTQPFRDIPDGDGGLWIGTQGEGLVHLTNEGKWEKKTSQSKFPLSHIYAIGYDAKGGMWVIGTQHTTPFSPSFEEQMKLTEIGGKIKLIHCTPENSELICDFQDLPSQIISKNTYAAANLLTDEKGTLWLGTLGTGLFHKNQAGQWISYNTSNSELPSDEVVTIVNDGNRGLWMGTGRGLAHFDSEQKWTIYTTHNSGLPSDYVSSIEIDSANGLWIGTLDGLAHLDSNGEWVVYTTNNSPLPSNHVNVLLKEDHNGLWIGSREESTYNQLITYLNGAGGWTTYPTVLDSFSLFLISDQQGGVWASTAAHGLAHFTREGTPTLYDSHNSGMPSNTLMTGLLSDGQGGLWVANFAGGLAHLTFGRQTELCTQTQIDAATCQAIQQGKHAAIVVAAGGAQETNTLWESTESITTRIYRTFYRRGMAKSEIYYLSPKTWADFDGDGFNDRINRLAEDRNLTLDDLTATFTWAKGLGKLDQPLYFFFMDHGGEGKLQLSPTVNIPAEELRALLDDYQNTTGNQVIVVIEACHSGSLTPILTAPNRAVITSAKADEKAYFFEKKGFSRFFTDYLLKGASFYESFTLASRDQDKLRGKNLNFQTAGDRGITAQTPQFDDNQDGTFTTTDGDWLKQAYVIGQFATADATLTVDNQTPSTALTVGQTITLQAKATLTQGTVRRVWAVIRPPAMATILDTNGTPILAFPRLNLGSSADNQEMWQAAWNEAVYNGNYVITFYAEDNEKNIASSEQDTVLTVSGGIDPPSQAQVQIHLDKTRYQRGEAFKATLTEDLGWGYDLYAAVVMPDGTFFTLKETNEFRSANEAQPWYSQRKPHRSLTLLDLTLPKNLSPGQYCLYGILSPEQNDVFETQAKGLWVMKQQCFEVF